MKENVINHLVITAAGRGSRMKLVDSGLPKEMLAIGGKPAIQYAIQEGISAQIENIVIVISPNKEMIRQYFENEDFAHGLYPEDADARERAKSVCALRFVYQNEPKGEVDAISQAEEAIGKNPFAVIYPDDIHLPSGVALRAVCDAFDKYRANVVALTSVDRENAHVIGDTGKVDIESLDEDVYRIRRFLPKSTGTFRLRYATELRACGLMVLHEDAFRYIAQARKRVSTGEFTDGQLRELMMKEHAFLGCKLDTQFFDVGNPLGYQRCLEYIQALC